MGEGGLGIGIHIPVKSTHIKNNVFFNTDPRNTISIMLVDYIHDPVVKLFHSYDDIYSL